MKLWIDVTCHNRKKITELCIQSLRQIKPESSVIVCRNDNSQEYDNDFLAQWADQVLTPNLPDDLPNWKRIHPIRYQSLVDFWNSDFEYLYLCDNDMIHDPEFFIWLNNFKNFVYPITGYISPFLGKRSKIIERNPNYLIFRGTTGGASMFLNRSHVKQVLDKRKGFVDLWDCQIWQILRNHILTPTISLVEHFGAGGLHHQDFEREKACWPSKYLQHIRPKILRKLR